jgi:predicted FMN-binding regulatory protein PaiB
VTQSAPMSPFDARSPEDVARLIHRQPFGWIVCGAGDQARATVLPLRPVFDAERRIVRLQGHMARGNPQAAALREHPTALILLLGPHGYVSPSWMADRTQAPTWNYASAQFLVDVTLVEDAEGLQAHLRDLVGAMEAGRPNAWSVDEMGARYESLARRIVGFDARVVETRARFKLGQDERDDVFADILGGLEHEGASELLGWMREFDGR